MVTQHIFPGDVGADAVHLRVHGDGVAGVSIVGECHHISSLALGVSGEVFASNFECYPVRPGKEGEGGKKKEEC